MKTMKRKFSAFLVLAMVLGLFSGNTAVHAEETSGTGNEGTTTGAAVSVSGPAVTYTLDLRNEYLNVEYGDATVKYAVINDELTLGEDGRPSNVKDAAYDLLEGKIIDLSWIKKNKDCTIVLVAENEKGVLTKDIKMNMQPVLKVGFAGGTTETGTASEPAIGLVPTPKDSKLASENYDGKVVGSKDVGYLYFYKVNPDKSIALVTPGAVQWKKGVNGTWETINTETFPKTLRTFRAKGATLYFQLAGTDAAGEENAVWASKEVKYGYKKQANAPSVKVDVAKNTLSLKSGQEYRVKVGAAEYGEWINVTKAYGEKTQKVAIDKIYTVFVDADDDEKNATIAKTDIYGASAQAITVQVRTAATDKKAAIPSKIKEQKIVAADLGTVEFNVTGSSIRVEYKNPEDTSKGLKVTNEYSVDYEYAVYDKNAEPGKFTAFKAGKAITLSTSKYTENSILAVRIAGNKQTGVLPSDTATYELKQFLNPVVTPVTPSEPTEPENATGSAISGE